MLQTKDLLELKPTNITNVTPSLATVTTLLSTAALLNSSVSTTTPTTTTTTTMATTTTTVSSVVDMLLPICTSEMTECPLPFMVTTNGRHDAASSTLAPPPTTTNASAHERSTEAKGSETGTTIGSTTTCSVDHGAAPGCGSTNVDGQTTSVEEQWTPPPPSEPGVLNATIVDYNVELAIDAKVVDHNVTEDVTANTVSVTTASVTDYESAENSTTTTNLAIESTISTSPSIEWSTATTSSATEWTATSPATEPNATSPATEPTASSINVAGVASTTGLDTESVANTTDDAQTDDRSYGGDADVVSDRPLTEENNNTRTKRFPEILFNGTHCYRIICSPRPPTPAPNVTEVPRTPQGFTEKPYSKYLYAYVMNALCGRVAGP